MTSLYRVFISLFILMLQVDAFALPRGFVYLSKVAPSIIQDIRYYQSNNFVGHPLPGYEQPECVLTLQAAKALSLVQSQLQKKGLSLKVYDCYRPVKAVQAFVKWSHSKDKGMKVKFYPREKKTKLFKKGYIAEYSGHSRGSTVDLTITALKGHSISGVDACYHKRRAQDGSLDMGTNFDCMDPYSHVKHHAISKIAKRNRQLLRRLMMRYGFKPYSKEWWHFTLRREPYPKRYFNFPIR